MVYYCVTTPKYQYWFRAILGRFSRKIFRVRPQDPPTYFHRQLGFLELFYFAKPLT